MMTSRERVLRAISFQTPDRVPYQLPEEFGTDFLQVGIGPDPNLPPRDPAALSWEDEWGCRWAKLPNDPTTGQVVGHSLTDYADLSRLRWPDYANPRRYAQAEQAIAAHHDDKFIIAFVPFSLRHQVEYLRGNETAWTDPYEYPEELGDLLDRLVEHALPYIDRLADLGVEGFFSADDWGLQDRLAISPTTFREFFLPRYARVWAHAHARGMCTFLHSCGHILEILGDLREAGLDVIQMDQQLNMGLEQLGQQYGGKICFWCPVDIQHVMPTARPEAVRLYARRLMDTLGRFDGGFIGKWYPFPQAVQHSWENIQAMSEEFITYGSTLYAGSGR